MSLLRRYKEALPEYVQTMPDKGKPLVWLHRNEAAEVERIRAHLNDRHYLMTDHDNGPIARGHELYDLQPNILVYNPTDPTRHQAFWLLRDAVHCQPEAQGRKPYKYLRAIEAAYDARYGCDPHFARHIHRNPLCLFSDAVWLHERAYTLSELAEPVSLAPVAQSRNKSVLERLAEGSGRNCTLFDELRLWAYRQAASAKTVDYDIWHRQVITRAIALNGFEAPLPAAEVYCVARSVAEFVYYRYQQGSGNAEITPEYRAKQAEKGRRGGLVSKGGGRPSRASELLETVLKLKAEGLTNRDIADDLGIGSATVSRYLAKARGDDK